MLAAAAVLFAALLMIGCFQRGKALVVIRASEIALAERDETVSLLLREFEDRGGDWLWETDAARRVVRASPRFARSVGLDPVTINGMPLLQVLAGPTWEAGNFAAGLRTLADKLKGREGVPRPAAAGAGRRARSAGSRSPPARATTSAARSSAFAASARDVTEQRASADKINRMARFDTLTGLPNRLLHQRGAGARDGGGREMGQRAAPS